MRLRNSMSEVKHGRKKRSNVQKDKIINKYTMWAWKKRETGWNVSWRL